MPTDYISSSQALTIIKKMLSEIAMDLEDDDYILIEDDGITVGKEDDFDADVMYYVIPATDVVIFDEEGNFTIEEEPILNAIDKL